MVTICISQTVCCVWAAGRTRKSIQDEPAEGKKEHFDRFCWTKSYKWISVWNTAAYI